MLGAIIGDIAGYPSIILRDEPEMTGGTLQAQNTIPGGNNLLSLTNAKVTLEGSLILAGTRTEGDQLRGVFVYNNSTFTMTGGEISENAAGYGGGVYLSGQVTSGARFEKTAGVIYGSDSPAAARNLVIQNSVPAAGLGHALYCLNASRYKDTTLGVSDDLSQNPDSGW